MKLPRLITLTKPEQVQPLTRFQSLVIGLLLNILQPTLLGAFIGLYFYGVLGFFGGAFLGVLFE